MLTTAQRHSKACKDYREAFLEENGYTYCEVCSRSDQYRYSVHHIYYASQWPKHPNLHDFKNLILVCEEDHRKFHSGENAEKFRQLEKERELKTLFS